MSIRDMAPFFAIIVIAIALFALYYVLRSGLGVGMKILWIVVILLLPFLGAVAYFLIYGTGGPSSDVKAHQDVDDINIQKFGK